MSSFDLLFLAVALFTIVTLVTATGLALSGKRTRAGRLLRRVAVVLTVYLGVGLAVAWLSPQRVLPAEEPWCFDDWCLAADRISGSPDGQPAGYQLQFRMFSRARRVSQRANGAWLYLVDAQGRRYAPTPLPDDVPLDVLLAPGESREARRRFDLPPGVDPVGLITGHGGGYCGPMSLLIIGQAGCLFGKPTVMGLPRRAADGGDGSDRSAGQATAPP